MPDNLEKILEKSMHNQGLSDDDLDCLLLHNNEAGRQKVFAASREVHRREFGNKVFLYGFVYISTIYHNDRSFCYYRSSNKIPCFLLEFIALLIAGVRKKADCFISIYTRILQNMQELELDSMFSSLYNHRRMGGL